MTLIEVIGTDEESNTWVIEKQAAILRCQSDHRIIRSRDHPVLWYSFRLSFLPLRGGPQ